MIPTALSHPVRRYFRPPLPAHGMVLAAFVAAWYMTPTDALLTASGAVALGLLVNLAIRDNPGRLASLWQELRSDHMFRFYRVLGPSAWRFGIALVPASGVVSVLR